MRSLHPDGRGWIEVICGGMYSGKSEELIRRLKRAQIAKLKTLIVKPEIDNRYSQDHVVTHDQIALKSELVSSARQILPLATAADVIGIDEAQFLDDELPAVVNHLANVGKRVIIAGLDMDFRGIPFQPMPAILAMAEEITKLHAICTVCGQPANYSYRITDAQQHIEIGSDGAYEARCRIHFQRGHDA